jgi:UDP-glucuronate 4-epimerase
MSTLISGAAGFIGSVVSIKLLERGDEVIGIDNHNNYYDPKLKDARSERLKKYSNYKHYKVN